jgi:outer membrane protein OmpA-like peptidoglycan-associated protein
MPENTQNRQTPCPLWIWAILLLGLILLYLLYSRATSEKAQQIQQDIQSRTNQSLLELEQTSSVSANTNGRDITLTGSVNNQDARAAAEKIAMRTVGVRQVDNQITVAEQGSSTKPSMAVAKLETMPADFPPLPTLSAKVETMPDEFAPLEDESAQTDEIAAIAETQEKFSQLDFSNVTFEKNSSALTAIAQQTLDSVAKTLLDNPSVAISVGGHTDSSGNSELNLKLSTKRATSVLNYLVSAGVDATRIEANGFGDQFPIAPNETEAGRIKNRRIEIKVKNGE